MKIGYAILLCIVSSAFGQAQNFEGIYQKSDFNCKISGTSEGYLSISEEKTIEIASHVPLTDGQYIQVTDAYWDVKKCYEHSFNVLFINKISQDSETNTSQNFDDFSSQITENAIDENQHDISSIISFTGSELTSAQATESLAFHNLSRQEVGVSPLSWSSELSSYAQEWADYLANNGCQLLHRPKKMNSSQYGENIYMGYGNVNPALDASKGWYSEIEEYRNTGSTYFYATGHYTQMVWRNTTKIGMGVARCPDGAYIVVANYDPPGNYIGEKPY